jgi:pimeloyl-ACP methyl ester carboxylesterase
VVLPGVGHIPQEEAAAASAAAVRNFIERRVQGVAAPQL